MTELPEYAVRNRASWTKANAEYTDRRARDAWAQEEITWGMCRARESDVAVLPDVHGRDVVELGCGTAYFGAWLKRRGARRVVGVDVTPAQLETARRVDAEFRLGLELVEGNAEETGLPGGSFDVAVSEYGASIWCDPYRWVPEAARLLRPGGELVFLRNATLAILCATDDGGTSETLQRPQRGLHRLDWEDERTTEFHLGHGDWVRLLTANGFELRDLVELYAGEDTPDHTYYAWSREWAERWPWEEIWRARRLR
ncbi:MAG: class I SAM-dependent methyltransferase [Actinomycetota bacterium]|nr:class I SAM-dependent methyltransferase [Actinomycetota bacterium]